MYYIDNLEKRIEELEAKLAEYENSKNWIRSYDNDGKLIDEPALYKPKL